jgi:hypothetical protein
MFDRSRAAVGVTRYTVDIERRFPYPQALKIPGFELGSGLQNPSAPSKVVTMAGLSGFGFGPYQKKDIHTTFVTH